MSEKLDLTALFQAVSNTMVDNQETLNQADMNDQDHGDNMVEVFQVITEAMQSQPNADPADQLAYASQLLRQREQNGSAQIYAQNLSQASQQFQGQSALTSDNAMNLIQSLLGGQQAAQQPLQQTDDPLSSLLTGLAGGGQTQEENSGFDFTDLMSAGMSFLSARQQGKSDTEALINALIAGSQAGQSPLSSQSGALVADTLLQTIGSLSNR